MIEAHIWTPRLLDIPILPTPSVTPEIEKALLCMRIQLKERLPKLFFEDKTIIVSVSIKHFGPSDLQRLLDEINELVDRMDVPLQVRRSDSTVDVCAREITKASILLWLTAELGLSKDKIAAFGDSPPDADMIRVAAPLMCGAPSNAHRFIQDLVKERGGYVSEYPCPEGTFQAILSVLLGLIRRATHGGC